MRGDGIAADVYGIDRDLIGSYQATLFTAEVKGDAGTTEDVSQSINWKNGNPSVVQCYRTIDGKFNIIPLKAGKAVITIIAADGTNTKATMTINVASLATDVTISGDDTVKQGKSIQLTAKVAPTYAENKKVKWSYNIKDTNGLSLSSKLVTLQNGKVTANRKIPVGAKITVWVDTIDGSMRTSDPYIITVD